MITGGGTGGHVYPALTVAEALEQEGLARRDEMVYVGSASGIEANLAPRNGIGFRPVAVAAVVGRAPWKLPAAAWRILKGTLQARRAARDFQPDAVLATGGYVSVPGVLGAWLAGVRTVIYLPDLQPGLAVRFLSRFATRVAVTDAVAEQALPKKKVVVTGYPVREAFARTDQKSARTALGLDQALPVVLVLGGSQGSQAINAALGTGLAEILAIAQVVHVTGPRNLEAQQSVRDGLDPALAGRYHLHPFLETEMPQAFAAADLIVCRAGASVLGELPVAGKPAILVPGDFAQGHQMDNARRLADAGAGAILRDAELDRLCPTILDLLADPARRERMAAAARALAKPDAAVRIARLLAAVAQERRAA